MFTFFVCRRSSCYGDALQLLKCPVILVQHALTGGTRAMTTRERLFRSKSKTSGDGVVSLVPDGLLITTPTTGGVPACPGSPLIQR